MVPPAPDVVDGAGLVVLVVVVGGIVVVVVVVDGGGGGGYCDSPGVAIVTGAPKPESTKPALTASELTPER